MYSNSLYIIILSIELVKLVPYFIDDSRQHLQNLQI